MTNKDTIMNSNAIRSTYTAAKLKSKRSTWKISNKNTGKHEAWHRGVPRIEHAASAASCIRRTSGRRSKMARRRWFCHVHVQRLLVGSRAGRVALTRWIKQNFQAVYQIWKRRPAFGHLLPAVSHDTIPERHECSVVTLIPLR